MQLGERVGRRIKLQDLHVLITVVDAGSMGKAAEVLRTSQPNVSRSIAELEHAVGVRLLNRDRQGVELTDSGRALVKRAQSAFGELRDGIKEIEFLADPTAGEVRVGSIIYLAANFVSAVIERMSQQYPRMAFDLLATDNQALRRALESRAIDLLVAQKFGSFADESLEFDALYHESYVVLAGASSPWARRRNIKLSDLVDEAWTLSSPDTVIGGVATEAFRTSGLKPPRVSVTTFPREVRMNLLATGRFLTISPTSVMKFSAKRSEFKVLPVQLPIAPVPVGIVSLKDRAPNPTSRLFVEHARAIAKSMAA